MAGVIQVAPPKQASTHFYYTNQSKLKWSHFTASSKRPEVDGKPVDAIVYMECEFDFTENGDIPLYQAKGLWMLARPGIKVVMDSKKSIAWKTMLDKSSDNQKAKLLEHERVHVELYERFGRTIFQTVRNMTSSEKALDKAAQDLVNKADKFRKSHWEKAKAKNDDYDRETNHGTIASSQKSWSELYLSVKNSNGVL